MSRPPLGSSFSVFGITIPWYSLLIMLGIAIGILLALREEKRRHFPKDTIINFALLAIPLGVIGARLYYVAFSWNRFSGNLAEIFRIWNGGLAIYGGILGALLAAWLLTRKGPVSFWSLLDACAPSLAIGQAIGRWGNYTNMEAYGARIYNEAAQFFPNAVEIPIIGANGTFWYWHMATFFYESILCAVIFAILWGTRKRMTMRGDTIRWYLLLYCAGRTVIEGLRDDSLLLNISAAQVRISQILSAVVCIGVLVVFFVQMRRAKGKPRPADFLCWAVAALSVACTFVGEFERNAYQMLFLPAQILLGMVLAADVGFFLLDFLPARKLTLAGACSLLGGLLCAATLALGIGRMGQTNTAYVALRQSVCMLHVILCGAWFYQRRGQADKESDAIESAEAIDAESTPFAVEAFETTLQGETDHASQA